MIIEIEIPKAFEEHFKLDKFKDSFDRFLKEYNSELLRNVRQGIVVSYGVCEWKVFDNSVEDDDHIWTYETGCKNYIEEEHTVHFKYCPYCGKKIKVVE